MINTSLNQRNEKQVVTTCTVEDVECLSKQNSLDREHKIKHVGKWMADKHCVYIYKKCWAAKPGRLNQLLSSSLNHCFFFLELWAKIHWTEMDRQWLSNELTEKEWLMNIADATHSAESSGSALMRTQNHSGCQRIFLVWIILAGSHWWQYHPPAGSHVMFCFVVLSLSGLLFLTPSDESALCVSGRHLATWTNTG